MFRYEKERCSGKFRKGVSTELATSKFCEDILTNLNDNNPTCAILLDLSKAFDSVDRDILLFKLYKCGIRGNMHSLLKSYLSSRSQYIQVDNTKSSLCNVNVGVPQGSIISPLLFLLHINDLSNCSSFQVINFADDTLLYHKVTDTTKCIEKYLNTEFIKVNNWMVSNKLKLNSSKTKFMIFTPNSPKFKFLNNIEIKTKDNTKLERVNECKYLGMVLDHKLNWQSHVNYLIKKISKTVGILYKTRQLLNKSSLMLILHSLFISHLKYGILCYGRANKSTLKPINVLFNRAIRCINFCKLRDKSTKDLYFDDRLLTLQNMFKLEVAKFCFRYVNGMLPESFDNILINTTSVHSHNTRNSQNFFQQRQFKKAGFDCLSHLGTKIWNQIPFHLKSETSFYFFGKKMKQHLILHPDS